MTGSGTRPEHRLAAIKATDVVGYSSLMQSDEAGALAALAAIREATQNQINRHQGRIANIATKRRACECVMTRAILAK
jgi:class 3 adenylate cyclase